MSSVSLFNEAPAKSPEEERIEQLLAGVKIPPQPRVLDEFARLLAQDAADVRTVARLLNQDPGIVGLLYKAVASPAYRRHQPFHSVERILQVVGLRQTFNIARAAALACLRDLQKNRGLCEAVWARSQAIAHFAMLVAEERIAVCNIFPDEAYMAGIFHDCGILLLSQRFAGYCGELHLGPPEKWSDVRLEDRRVQADHAVVGYMVARHWHLPPFVCEAIRYHHDLTLLGDHGARSIVAILQLATELYYREQHASNPEWPEAAADVLAELGLSQETLPEFADIIAERALGLA